MIKPRKVTAIAIATLAILGVAQAASGVLVDIAGHWAAPIVGALEAKGIIAGDLQGRFSPEDPLTRAQMAKLIVLGVGNDADAAILGKVDSRFTDVPRWHWANGYIEALAELGITDGYPGGSFGPNDRVTRAQMAVFLVRAVGQAEDARLKQFDSTAYRDDKEIPDWARGAVHVALSSGLMAGFEDGTFRPLQPITKAEGSVALFRFMARKGTAYHLSGTLVRFDPIELTGVVRDERGQERSFTMDQSAQYYRGGVYASRLTIARLDQVWIVLGPDGKGRLLEARYKDVLGSDAKVNGNSVTLTSNGTPQGYAVQSGARIMLNGRQVSLQQVDGAPEVYVVLDQDSGEVHILDAVNAPIRGEFVFYDSLKRTLLLVEQGQVRSVGLAPDAVVLRNGSRVNPEDLVQEDRLRIAVDAAGVVTYVQAER